jgi:hypothetical protein
MSVHRILLVLAVLALAAPATASAQAKKAPAGAPASAYTQWGVLVGMEDGDGPAGIGLRVDGVFPFKPLSPKVRLSWVGSVGFRYVSDDTATPLGDYEASAFIPKFVASARFSMPLSPSFELYGDAGLGLYVALLSVSGPDGLGGTFEDSETEFGMLMRFAVGGMFSVSPTFKLGAEMGLNPYFGEVDDNTFSLLAAAQFRF